MKDHLRTLPRDARDTLFLLGVIAWCIAPQTPELPLWCSAMAACTLVWRARLAWRGGALPARGWLLALVLVAVVGTLASHRTLLGRDAGVTFLVVLLALKTMEMRARRDIFVLFYLGLFTLLSNFFFSQSLLVAAAMLVGLQGLLTALVNSHMPVGAPPLREAAKTAGWMTLVGAPIMVVLFVLFPRVAPLWGVPEDAMQGRTGLSSSMEVGTIAKLAQDSSVAMRIAFAGTEPPRQDLYFRGPVLSSFDGVRWRPLHAAPRVFGQAAPNLRVEGPPLRYEVTQEPQQQPWLLVLDGTPEAPQVPGFTPSMGADLQWQVERPITELLRYQVQSYLRFSHGSMQAVAGLREYLALPTGFNPRTLALAADLRNDPRFAGASGGAFVQEALHRLRTGGYRYTLEPGVFGMHTADEFWFDRKEGFCEHIASSFVILMRALGVPARIVTGYQGGERNELDGLWTVRQSDAHAWAEVWIANQGWQRVDPTSAVAPGRTGTLQRLQAPEGVFTRALLQVNPGIAFTLRAFWDATNTRWNQWVLTYAQDRQRDLLRTLGFSAPSWEDLIYVMGALLAITSLGTVAWMQWDKYRQDPWLRLLAHAARRLQRYGVPVRFDWQTDRSGIGPGTSPGIGAATTPRRLAQALAGLPRSVEQGGARDHARRLWIDWLTQLEAWRYAPHNPDAHPHTRRLERQRSLSTLRRTMSQLPPPL